MQFLGKLSTAQITVGILGLARVDAWGADQATEVADLDATPFGVSIMWDAFKPLEASFPLFPLQL